MSFQSVFLTIASEDTQSASANNIALWPRGRQQDSRGLAMRANGNPNGERSREGADQTDSKVKLAALERILQSGTFATAESIRQILRFMIEQSVTHRVQ